MKQASIVILLPIWASFIMLAFAQPRPAPVPQPVTIDNQQVIVDGARLRGQFLPKQVNETIISMVDAFTTRTVVVDVPTTRAITLYWFNQDDLTTGSAVVVVDAMTTGTRVQNLIRPGVRFDRLTGDFLRRGR